MLHIKGCCQDDFFSANMDKQKLALPIKGKVPSCRDHAI